MAQMLIAPEDTTQISDKQLKEIVGVGPATFREIRGL
jgi:hypothetical protein